MGCLIVICINRPTLDMYFKYGTLLQNIPVRHLIQPMKKGEAMIKKQLMLFDEIDLHNVFLVGDAANIKSYLATANMLKMFGKKYSWFAVTKVRRKS